MKTHNKLALRGVRYVLSFGFLEFDKFPDPRTLFIKIIPLFCLRDKNEIFIGKTILKQI